jgi:hypothetical protein
MKQKLNVIKDRSQMLKSIEHEKIRTENEYFGTRLERK